MKGKTTEWFGRFLEGEVENVGGIVCFGKSKGARCFSSPCFVEIPHIALQSIERLKAQIGIFWMGSSLERKRFFLH